MKSSNRYTLVQYASLNHIGRVDVSAFDIKLDYSLSNIKILSGATIKLPRIQLRGLDGVHSVLQQIGATWAPVVLDPKRLAKIASMGISPVRTVVKIGTGFADLFMIPATAYINDDNVIKGFQKAADSFSKNTGKEVARILKITGKVTIDKAIRPTILAMVVPDSSRSMSLIPLMCFSDKIDRLMYLNMENE